MATDSQPKAVGLLRAVSLFPSSDESAMEVDSSLNRESLHRELRERIPILAWTLLIFNPVFVGWSVFDYLLEPEQWFLFLEVRVSVAVFSALVAVFVSGQVRAVFSWEALWTIAFTQMIALSFMLPRVAGENLSRYILGYILVIFAVGIFPSWPVRWTASLIFSSLTISTVMFYFKWEPSETSYDDVVSNVFVVVTASTVSLLIAAYRYGFSKRDFFLRVKLSDIARKESEARLELADTSKELQSALEKLKELDRLKSKFFANISHELRTPLTLILAPVDELAQRANTEEDRQQLRVIRRNADRLLRLISDLLDLSRLDAGGLRLNLAELDVRSIAAAVYENSGPDAKSRGVNLVLDSKPSGRKILGDAHRLEIVVTNLVSNAVKFTPPGGTVEIRVEDRADDVSLSVTDNGQGIPPEDLARVFERFFQVMPGDRRREGGVGIGLALAKELIDLHGGEISVDSTPDVQTVFSVYLPFGRDHIRPEVVERRKHFEHDPVQSRRAEDPEEFLVDDEGPVVVSNSDMSHPAEEDQAPRGSMPNVLLVDDHKEVRDFVEDLLRPHARLSVAEDGQEALEIIKESPPDLVVSDVMMPRMTGTELCSIVKRDPKLRSIPIILLTAKAGSEATLEAYAHGADDFVVKPFHPRVLVARIRAQLKLRALSLQLVQQEKMAVVGTLAAGILHELRNPVNAILNASRVLSTDTASQETATEMLGVIAEGATRIVEITAALDSHAKPAEAGVMHACDPREGLESTLRIIKHRLEGIQVHQEYETERFAQAPAGPLNQIFLNLLDNSIRIGVANIWLRMEERAGAILVSVADDGPGVQPEDIDRIFDPFFSNRKDGSGSGLGLYLSRKMAEDYGGSLEYRGRYGGGAEFVVEVPAIGSGSEGSN